jgi:hypothetical protein
MFIVTSQLILVSAGFNRRLLGHSGALKGRNVIAQGNALG